MVAAVVVALAVTVVLVRGVARDSAEGVSDATATHMTTPTSSSRTPATTAGAPVGTTRRGSESTSRGSDAPTKETTATQPTTGSQPTTGQPTSTTGATSGDTGAATSAPTTSQPEPGSLTVTDGDRATAAARVATMSLADKAASVLMVTGSAAINTGLLGRQHFGGVVLFAPGGVVDGTANGTPSQVAAVTAALRDDAAADPAGAPPLIATDQEYGAVQRLKNGFTSFPSAAALGAIGGAEGEKITRQVAYAAAREMRAVGITVDFAPVFGVLPSNGSGSAIGRYGRSYGSDPEAVAGLVAAAVEGYQAGGVVAGLKHFPGLARIAEDSHVTLPTLPATCADWNAHEAIPAKAGVDAGAIMMMTGHVLFPAVGASSAPTSIDQTVVGTLLKGTGVAGCAGMDFSGVAVTDSLQMEPIAGHYSAGDAAVAALAAGEDLLLMSADPVAAAAGIVDAIQNGTLAQSRLDDAATAVLALRIAVARLPAPPLDVVNSAEHRALATRAAAAGR